MARMCFNLLFRRRKFAACGLIATVDLEVEHATGDG